MFHINEMATGGVEGGRMIGLTGASRLAEPELFKREEIDRKNTKNDPNLAPLQSFAKLRPLQQQCLTQRSIQ